MAQFFTDFSEYTVDAAPSDWTARFNSALANVRDSGIPESTSDLTNYALEFNSTQSMSWDVPGSPSGDTEIAVLVWATSLQATNTDRARFFLHGSEGSSGERNMYAGAFTSAGSWIEHWANGTDFTVASGTGSIGTGAWRWVRFRRSENELLLRWWALGESEPDTWARNGSQESRSTGFVGVDRSNATGTLWVAAWGVGTNGDSAPIEPVGPEATEVAARFTFGLRTDASAVQQHQISTRFGFGFQQRTDIDAELTPTEIAARFELGLAQLLAPEQEHQIAARFGLGLGQSTSLAGGEVDVAARFVLGMGQELDLQMPTAIGARFALGMGLTADAISPSVVGARFRMGLMLRENYTGPGTGIQTVGIQTLPLLLQEGDTFQLDRPYGGLQGQAGLARVLALTLDDDLDGDWQIQMIPHTTGAFAVLIDELGRPRYTVDLSGNLFRQVRELQRRR